MSQREFFSLDLPADLRYLHMPGACLAELFDNIDEIAKPEAPVYGLRLAVYEVCTNIVVHSYRAHEAGAADKEGSRIRVVFTVALHPPLLTIDLYDTGYSFDISAVPEPGGPEPQTRGYGLYLVRQLVDEVMYEVEPGGNHWRLTKRL